MNLSLIESLQKISDDIPIKNEWLWNQRYIFYKMKLNMNVYKDYISLCKQLIEESQNIKLKKKNKPYRTMYDSEYLIFWYFEKQLKKTKNEEEKKNLNDSMRHTLLVVNNELDKKEKILKEKEKKTKLEKSEENRKKREEIKKLKSEEPIRRSNRKTKNVKNV
jgi:hypothetical protein